MQEGSKKDGLLNGVDVVGLWEMFLQFMDNIIAWLYVIIEGADWDPDYGRN